MTRKNASLEKVAALFRPRRRKVLAAVFIVLFFLGYNLTLSRVQYCSAAPPPTPTVPTSPGTLGNTPTIIPAGTNPPPPPLTTTITPPIIAGVACPQGIPCPPAPCELPGTSATVTNLLIQALLGDLKGAANALENWLDTNITAMLVSEYDQLDWLERSMTYWWDTMWYYNILPSFHEMTKELNVELAFQTQQLEANADASAVMETGRAYAKHEIQDQEQLHPIEQVCVAATQIGGFSRATIVNRAMRQAWETKSLAPGLNEKTDADGQAYPGATSAAGFEKQRYDDWRDIFCDAQGNSATNMHCGSSVDKNLINADVLPVKYLFNNLTIEVDDKTSASNGSTEGKNLELGLEYLINNMVGIPTMDASVVPALASPAGEEGYLLRRSYLARYAAIRAVPDMIAGWRMPGGGTEVGKWVTDLRESGGVPSSLLQDSNNGAGLALTGLSKNPSYKEIMHALSIDRFNSGMYANDMLTDPARVDREKLDISVLYLMQLRDYYELLERTALTLAVQVSVLADEQTLTPPAGAQPFRQGD